MASRSEHLSSAFASAMPPIPGVKTRKEPTNLLDLPDGLLLKILGEHLEDLASIVRVGAVNRQLNTLCYSLNHLGVDVHAGPGETHLLGFLWRAGLIQNLIIRVTYNENAASVWDNEPLLNWVQPVSNTLQSLALAFLTSQLIHTPLLGDLRRCTKLERLVITGDETRFSSRLLARVVASCPKLYALIISTHTYGDTEVLKLVSSSLQKIELSFPFDAGLSVTLNTPALVELQAFSATKVIINSHALKYLQTCDILEERLMIRSSCPLSNLEFLVFGGGWSTLGIRKVLSGISGGRVEKMVAMKDIHDPDGEPMSFEEFLRPLSQLRSFGFGCFLLEMFAARSSSAARVKETLERLGVEEMELQVDDLFLEPEDELIDPAEQYRHVARAMALLRSFLSSSSLRKLVIDDFPYSENAGSNRAAALKLLLKSLKHEFPGVVSERVNY